MTQVRADTIYSDLRRTPDGYAALCSDGWHSAEPGDALDFGNGVIVEILTPAMIGGGTWIAGSLTLIAGFAVMVAAAAFGFGKGTL